MGINQCHTCTHMHTAMQKHTQTHRHTHPICIFPLPSYGLRDLPKKKTENEEEYASHYPGYTWFTGSGQGAVTQQPED